MHTIHTYYKPKRISHFRGGKDVFSVKDVHIVSLEFIELEFRYPFLLSVGSTEPYAECWMNVT